MKSPTQAQAAQNAAHAAPAGHAAPSAATAAGTAAPAAPAGHAGGPTIQRREQTEAHMRPFQWTIFKRIMAYIKPYWPIYALGVFCAVSIHAIGLIPPLLVRQAIDDNVAAGDINGLIFTGILYVLTMLAFFFIAAGRSEERRVG